MGDKTIVLQFCGSLLYLVFKIILMPSIFLHLFIIIIIILKNTRNILSTLRYGSLSELFFLSF